MQHSSSSQYGVPTDIPSLCACDMHNPCRPAALPSKHQATTKQELARLCRVQTHRHPQRQECWLGVLNCRCWATMPQQDTTNAQQKRASYTHTQIITQHPVNKLTVHQHNLDEGVCLYTSTHTNTTTHTLCACTHIFLHEQSPAQSGSRTHNACRPLRAHRPPPAMHVDSPGDRLPICQRAICTLAPHVPLLHNTRMPAVKRPCRLLCIMQTTSSLKQAQLNTGPVAGSDRTLPPHTHASRPTWQCAQKHLQVPCRQGMAVLVG